MRLLPHMEVNVLLSTLLEQQQLSPKEWKFESYLSTLFTLLHLDAEEWIWHSHARKGGEKKAHQNTH